MICDEIQSSWINRFFVVVVAHAAVGFLLWLVGIVLLMLSFLDRRFAAAAARLAHAALTLNSLQCSHARQKQFIFSETVHF